MSNFSKAVITTQGSDLLAKASAGLAKIQFTSMVSGNGVYTPEEAEESNLKAQTSLKSQVQSVPFTKISKYSTAITRLAAVFSNVSLSEGYYMWETGLYAKDTLVQNSTPILYSVAVAEEADYIPPYNGIAPAKTVQEYYMTISNDLDITIEIVEGVYALEADLELIENKVNRISEVIFQGKANALKVSRMMEGVSFDGSSDLSHLYSTSTAEETPEKVASPVVAGLIAFTSGLRIALHLINGNTASPITLRVSNNATAYPVLVNGNGAMPEYPDNTVLELYFFGGVFNVVGVSIANNLTTTAVGLALDARQGKILADGLAGLTGIVSEYESNISAYRGVVAYGEFTNAASLASGATQAWNTTITGLKKVLTGKVVAVILEQQNAVIESLYLTNKTDTSLQLNIRIRNPSVSTQTSTVGIGIEVLEHMSI